MKLGFDGELNVHIIYRCTVPTSVGAAWNPVDIIVLGIPRFLSDGSGFGCNLHASITLVPMLWFRNAPSQSGLGGAEVVPAKQCKHVSQELKGQLI